MRKNLLTAVLSIIAACPLFAQDSLTTSAINKAPYAVEPLLIIKGDELSRYPSPRFLDAVNGLFPWVFAQAHEANNYLYVVNGNIISDINGISLYDIEEVVFTRTPLDASLYPFSRAGTFYITTKRSSVQKTTVRFNTQYNIAANDGKLILRPGAGLPTNLTGTETDNRLSGKQGSFFSNHLSVSTIAGKLHLYASAQLENYNVPRLSQQSEFASGGSQFTANATRRSRQQNLKAFINLGYSFSNKISAGITANYFHGNTKIDSTRDFSYTNTLANGITNERSKSSAPVNYYHIGAFVNVSPVKNLNNKLSFEYTDSRYDFEENTESSRTESISPPAQLSRVTAISPTLKTYVLRDHLSYSFSAGKFNATTNVIYSHIKHDLDYKSIDLTYSGGFPNGISFHYFPTQQLSSINPFLNLSFNEIVSAYGGYAFLLKREKNVPSTGNETNPYAGLTFNLASLLKATSIQRLDIGFHYANLTINNSDNYLLPLPHDARTFFPNTQLTGNYAAGALTEAYKNKMLSVQLNAEFMKGRIQAGAEWSQLKYAQVFIVPMVIFPGGGFVNYEGKVTESGISIYGAASVIDKPQRQWKTRLNLLFADLDYDVDDLMFSTIQTTYGMRAGWQNQFKLGALHLQLNGLLGLNRQQINHAIFNPPSEKKGNEIVLNYISAGYDLPVPVKSIFRDTRVFIQARNVVADKETQQSYWYDSYVGIGVNWGIL